MMSTLRASWKAILGGGAVALALSAALAGCRVATDLADATQNGAGGDDGTSSQQTGGTTSMGGGSGNEPGTGGSSSEIGGAGGTGAALGGTGGTSSEVGGTGGTGGAAPSGGTGGECWDPTVQNFCEHFDCPVSAQAPAWPTVEEVIEHYEDTGVCDEHTVMLDKDDCGAMMLGYEGESAAESYLFVTGTLGATAISRDTPFGPCNQTSYYGGIEADEWYATCNVQSRCVACGPPLPENPQYAPCRSDCECETIEPGPDPCFGADSCECYCYQSSADRG
jgi:hypothetical protein